MEFELAGRKVEYDIAALDIGGVFGTLRVWESIAVKKHTGLGLLGLSEGLKAMDPEALMILTWLALQRAGETVKPSELDFDMIAFAGELGSQLKVDKDEKDGKDEEEDPTQPTDSSLNGKIPWPAVDDTSALSLTTSIS